ncbi:MAG: thioredoxin-disulfide reductase [Helicobacteraceae bacterium]
MIDLAIVGGGPAGLTAGLYATRGGLKNVIMFEPGMPGGQITSSSEIENYPGQLEVVSGLDLMQDWPKQAQKFGLKHEMKEVLSIQKVQDTFVLELSDKTSVEAASVIVATGSVPKKGGFKGESEFFGRGISTCATCDGFFYKNKEVAMIGGGDSALEEAIYMSHIASKVYLIHRRDSFRASPTTVARVQENDKIELVLNAAVEEVFGDASGVSGVRVKTPDGERTINVPGVFVFVGRDVKNSILKDKNGNFICEMTQNGQVKTDLKMHTSLKGLFVAGDVREDAARQVVCAASDGAVAALEAIAFLQGH